MASWRQILAAHRNDGSHEDTILAALECGDDAFARWVVVSAELDRLKPLIEAAYKYREAYDTYMGRERGKVVPSILASNIDNARNALCRAAEALPPREGER